MKKLLYTFLAVSIVFSACEEDTPLPSANNNGSSSIYTYVPDDNFEIALINLGLDNTLNDTVLTEAIDTLGVLNIGNQNISDLTGIEDFTALTVLWCTGNQLTSLDISANTALNTVFCQGNQLTSLNLSGATALDTLDCENNQLASLDVSNTALTYLLCNGNLLTSLDVSQNTALTRLMCYNNQLTSLNISNNTALTHLYCSKNQLTSLDVSANTTLIMLFCSDNQLTSLDLRNGNNYYMDLYAGDNTSLYCIDVDNEAWSNIDFNNNWSIPSQSFYSEDCGVK